MPDELDLVPHVPSQVKLRKKSIRPRTDVVSKLAQERLSIVWVFIDYNFKWHDTSIQIVAGYVINWYCYYADQ
jgi:hypothetical protein